MKKGFTLIEMLGIIAVLGVVLLVTFPIMNKSLKQMKKNTNDNFTNNLKVSAEAYIELNRDNYPELKEPYSQIEITVQQLYDSNLLKGQYDNINTSDKIKVIVDQDLILRYYFNGEQIGFDKEIDDNLTRELALIKENLNQSIPDGIYYYTEQGNLENNPTQINLTRNWGKPYGNILVHNHQLLSGCIQMNNKNYDYYKGQITEQTYPCSTIRGENLVVNGDLSYKDNTNFTGYTYAAEEGTNGYLSLTTSTSPSRTIDNFVPIDIYNKSYQMGMTARSNQSEAKYYIGIRSYDIDRQEISPAHVSYIPNTLTTLSRDLNDGDEYIYLTDLSNWNNTTTNDYQRAFIFWNYKDSTGYEYPELTYSRNISNSDTYSNSNIDLVNNRIKLNSPWNKGYVKAGTKISQRSSGVTFIYNMKTLESISTEWENIEKIQTGILNTGTIYPYTKFWYGTRYVKVSWYNNYRSTPNTTTDFKDIYIREVTE